MDSTLLLHPKTAKQLGLFLKRPSHAILIYGPQGMGKRHIVLHLSANLIGILPAKLDEHPYYYKIEKDKDKQEISIDAIRQINKKLGLKTVIPSSGPAKRVVSIINAENLSLEAQNALLKMLEEPPDGTVFVLSASSDTAVLPTIASRLQKTPIAPITQAQASQYFSGKYSASSIESAWRLSQGGAGLLSSLLANVDGHELRQAVELAKKFLSMKIYERIIFMDKLSGNKAELLSVLDALSRILAALQVAAVQSSNLAQSKKIVKARKLVESTTSTISKNTSARLAGLNLALKLPV
jgi:DNA polymerase-3 subunit delta'